jgi:AraC-like DNA-binding protein
MDNINKEIREKEIAEKCHCSTTYFSKKFHLHFGVSFRDFVCDKRILLAKKLIEADTESKIAVIAYQCGYKDVSYFSRIFKKRTGVTFFCNFFFSDLFVYVVHNKVDDF